MGLDLVELTIWTEETFQIEIDQEDYAAAFFTAGSLHHYVWQRLQGVYPALRIEGFELTNQIQAAVLSLPGARSTFWSTFERMIPRQNRLEIWALLSRDLHCPLPPLVERPGDPILRFPKFASNAWKLAKWILKQHADRFPPVRESRSMPAPPGADQWTEDAVWQQIQSVLSELSGIDPSRIERYSELIDDLGLS